MQLNTSLRSFICLFTVCFLFIFNSANAQKSKNDVIIKRDSTRIQALIIQMSYEKINYRDLGTADSAKTFISLDKVARVILKTGKIINVRDSVLATHTPPDSVGQYADLAHLPKNEFDKSIIMANSDQLRDKYRYYKDKSIDGKTGCIVFTSIGVATLVAGLIVANTGTSPDNKDIGNSLAIAGPVVGGALGLVGFYNFKRYRTKAGKAKSELERRNQPLSYIGLSPGINPMTKSGYLTLKISF